jgi:hypothetical protein
MKSEPRLAVLMQPVFAPGGVILGERGSRGLDLFGGTV